MEPAAFIVPQIAPLGLLYFVLKDDARVYRRFTKAQKICAFVGFVFYILGMLVYAFTWALG
jgi:hypothetical protein